MNDEAGEHACEFVKSLHQRYPERQDRHLLYLDLFLLTSFDGDPVGPFEGDSEGESVGLKVVGLDVGCVNK